MRITYDDWKPRGESLDLVVKANLICAEYQQSGYELTLRQLYYQFVARGWLGNTQKNYDRLGAIINKARMAGLLDWSYIEDRTRNLMSLSHWRNPDGVIRSAASSFGMDLWRDQPTRVEVWVEKEALAGVISRAASRYDCAWFSCRGYVSQSEMHAAGQRIGSYIEGGQNVVIVHLGDHDPSGIDMTRDIKERIEKFIYTDWFQRSANSQGANNFGDIADEMAEHCGCMDRGEPVFEVRRIALNMDQVEEYNPPPNPAKMSDSRAGDYVRDYGDESWELDALDPATLDALITSTIDEIIDTDVYEAARDEQERHRELLITASDRWAEVAEYLQTVD